jgi:hypothetical protein
VINSKLGSETKVALQYVSILAVESIIIRMEDYFWIGHDPIFKRNLVHLTPKIPCVFFTKLCSF